SVDSSDGMMKTTERQIITDARQVSLNDQSEHREAKNTSKNSVKKLSETKERVLQNSKVSLSDRSTTSVHLKRKGKVVPSTSPVSSQYLGSLKVLEDKSMQQKSSEFNKVDNLRAAVFQNWLEKKKLFILELKRSEKEKAEILRNNTEKKEALKREEAIACYEAWKKKKDKEAKKLREKKKLEELEKKKPAEQNKEKTEAAQAVMKEKQSERMRKTIEEDLVAEKRRVSVSAVEKWNEKKEEHIKKKKAEKILEKRKREMQKAKKEEKSEKAMEEYERWLENKMRREQLEKKRKKLQAVHGNEMSPPWRPPGKVTYSSNY
ncbi:MAP9 protein, partial [Sylvia borin]|nr:MAP9 protein [Sylvia borin]